MQGIKAALHTATHLEQIVQSGGTSSGTLLGIILGGLGKVESGETVEYQSFTELLLISCFFIAVPSASMTRLARSRTYSAPSNIGSEKIYFTQPVTSSQSDGAQEVCEAPNLLSTHQTMEVPC
uniref:Uncharacterized protein n=1 Tax=Peromyscus maniculatus bairdii TaxID=230844 RepID=A0A8C8UDL2_PERMB